MSQSPVNSYDAVPYASHPFRQSHPAHLATVAALCGITAPSVASARVLELGSASGGNIIPFACEYPHATVLGIDSSVVHVEEGRRTINALGISNLDLRHGDILSLDDSLGEFDFIICHGVFSWVSPEIQEKILSLAGDLLAPDGIAFVSYNTYPGWHLRGVVRELMQQCVPRGGDPAERVARARRMLAVTAGLSTGRASAPYGELLQNEAEILEQRPDSYIYHEHLEEHFGPLYFRDFIRRAGQHGLEYLGEAQLSTMALAQSNASVARAFSSFAADTIEREQYLDFVCNRTFRETLLCRAGRKPSHVLSSRSVWPMHIASSLQPSATPVDLSSSASTTFVGRLGASLSTTLPLFKAALLELACQWPAGIPFGQLLTAAAKRLGIVPDDLQRTFLAQTIISQIKQSNMIEVSLEPSRFTIAPGDRPVASPLARRQALESTVVTNRRYERVELSTAQRRVLLELNKTQDVAQVARATELSPETVRQAIADLTQCALIIE